MLETTSKATILSNDGQLMKKVEWQCLNLANKNY